MKASHPLRAIPLILLACATQTYAATAMEVNISLTIPASISIVWNHDSSTTEIPWAIGTAALSGTYETYTPTNGTGGSWSYANGATDLKVLNQSNSNVQVEASVVASNLGTTASTTTAWDGSADGSVGANKFNLRVAVGAANAAAVGSSGLDLAWNKGTTTGTSTSGLITSIANGAASGRLDFQLKTPSSITVGGGTAQRVIVRLTASVVP